MIYATMHCIPHSNMWSANTAVHYSVLGIQQLLLSVGRKMKAFKLGMAISKQYPFILMWIFKHVAGEITFIPGIAQRWERKLKT